MGLEHKRLMVVYNEPTNTSLCDLSTWNGAFNTSEICISQSGVENDKGKCPKWRESTSKTEPRAEGPLDSQGSLREGFLLHMEVGSGEGCSCVSVSPFLQLALVILCSLFRINGQHRAASVCVKQIHSSPVPHGIFLTCEHEGHIGLIPGWHNSEKVLSWEKRTTQDRWNPPLNEARFLQQLWEEQTLEMRHRIVKVGCLFEIFNF
jgi:hypothetical protein